MLLDGIAFVFAASMAPIHTTNSCVPNQAIEEAFIELPSAPLEGRTVTVILEETGEDVRDIPSGESENDSATNPPTLMVRDISQDSIPENIVNAALLIKSYLLCDDYQAFLSIYENRNPVYPESSRIVSRLSDLRHYLYNAWNIEQETSDLSRMLNCISSDPDSIEVVFILSAYLEGRETTRYYNGHLSDIATILAHRLSYVCSP